MAPELRLDSDSHPLLGNILKMQLSVGGPAEDIFMDGNIKSNIIKRYNKLPRDERAGRTFNDEDVKYFIGLARDEIHESLYFKRGETPPSLCLKFDSPMVAKWVLNNTELKDNFSTKDMQMMLVNPAPSQGLNEMSPIEDLMIRAFNHIRLDLPFNNWEKILFKLASFTRKGFDTQYYDLQPDSPLRKPLKILRAVMRAILNRAEFLEHPVINERLNSPMLDEKGKPVFMRYNEEQKGVMKRFYERLQESGFVRDMYDMLVKDPENIPEEFPGGAQLVVVLPYSKVENINNHMETYDGHYGFYKKP
jgi:hypothetical protein